MPAEAKDHSLLMENRLAQFVQERYDVPDVPLRPSPVQIPEAGAFVESGNAFWLAAKGTLYNLVRKEHTVGLVAGLLDVALAVQKQGENTAVALFALQEEAFQVLPLAQMRQLIKYLELRRTEYSKYALGEASIVLLRTGRAILNRLEPRLHARDTGRVIAYLALSKGLVHASRLNRKGIVNQRWIKSVDGADFSIEYVVHALQDPNALAASPEPERFLSRLLHRLTRLILQPKPADFVPWKNLTWEKAEYTLNGFLIVFQASFALYAFEQSDNENVIDLVARITARITKLFSDLNLTAAAERLVAREKEWKHLKSSLYSLPETDPVELPHQRSTENSGVPPLPPLEHSLGNANLSQLWSVTTGLRRFEETIDWAERANEFDVRAKDESGYKFMALRCRSLADVSESFSRTSAPEHDLSEWEAKLMREQQPKHTKEPLKRPSEQPDPAPKRTRMAYEDADRLSAIDRQRAIASTARPLPY